MAVEASKTRVRVDPETYYDIEQFLLDEADLLDERRFEEWIELMADDVHYWMPTRSNRLARELDREISAPDEAAFFDETKEHLQQRLFRLQTGMAWAEDPPSRTRHLVTNLRVYPTDDPNEYDVETSFLLYRTRLEREMDLFVGKRFDRLRRADNPYGWQIAKRKIILDQSTLLAKNLSSFF
jgi:3-phenylpropionate/cinnamic acid dioxygenase small subunit